MEAKNIYKKQQGKDPCISANEEEHGLPIYIESRSLHYVRWLENWVEKNAQQQESKEQAENVLQQTQPAIAELAEKFVRERDLSKIEEVTVGFFAEFVQQQQAGA